ncbi:MAG: hypothetical protein NWF11_06195, partial [Candidatus Bathyarchaeota archaeon]|nr:hypothetical protein [Candidatus Bathyarchaeota archaeon]
MKQAKKVIATGVASLLAISLLLPLITHPAAAVSSAKPEILPYGPDNRWLWIKTGSINIIFPAGGEKPMFLWWYSDDPSNVYVVKYKGLVEFLTFDQPYYRR